MTGGETWTHAGLRCSTAPGIFGCPCGYVELPDGHPLSLASARRVAGALDVHGGVTYVGPNGPGREVGFDMSHPTDVVFDGCEVVPLRTFDECRAETERLAEQVAATWRAAGSSECFCCR